MKSEYVKGIDGLRALAVLSVIFYHLNPNWLPGGFTGVDIFFVISGYVVAKSLNARKEHGFTQFILDFFKRRIIRIYPALLFCLLISSIFTVLFIPGSSIGKSIDLTALSAFFGISNFVLAFDTKTYFSPSADFNPFVHTWSLGIEEQFYLIFPFLFYLSARQKFKYALPILFLVSLLLSIYHTRTNTNFAYYLLTSRFWELAAGVLLYQLHQSNCSAKFLVGTKVAVLLGFLSIFISLIWSDKASFPFPWAIFSVVGTCLLIHAIVLKQGYSNDTHILFGNDVAIHLGKLSFSLYLWHWPVFTFYRWSIGLETLFEIVTALTLTYLMSALSYYVLERRIPNLKYVRETREYRVLLTGIAVIVVCFFITQTGFNNKSGVNLSKTADKDIWSPYLKLISEPSSGKELSGITLYVLGDSHANAYKKMFRRFSRETGASISIHAKGGCGITNLKEPVLETTHKCYDKVKGWLAEIEQQATSRDIIFVSSSKTYSLVNSFDLQPGDPDRTLTYQSAKFVSIKRERSLNETLAILERLLSVSQNLVVDAPKPVFNYIPFRCADWYTKDNPICSNGHIESRQLIDKLRQPAIQSLNVIKNQLPKVNVWDPIHELCSDIDCSVYRNGKPIFSDANHLTAYGNTLLYPSFKHQILEVFYKSKNKT